MSKNTTNQRGGFRSKEQRERDRAFISSLFVKNYGLAEMARMLQEFVQDEGDDYRLSPQQIWYDCKAIMVEWKRTRLKMVDDYVELELKKLDKIENELWTAWERSKGGKRKTKIEGGTASGGTVSGGTLKERQLEDTNGDPRYLDQIMHVMDRRAKLLGYNAPVKIEVSRTEEKTSPKVSQTLDGLPLDMIKEMSDKLMEINRN